ncbi:UNVERIFIED_CONTAM: hypothetical protein FKN15_018478 [Acipenser sinensis]
MEPGVALSTPRIDPVFQYLQELCTRKVTSQVFTKEDTDNMPHMSTCSYPILNNFSIRGRSVKGTRSS